MVTNPVLLWALTLGFLAVAAHCVVGILRAPGRGAATVGHVCHLLMSLDMVAMAWPWWTRIPVAPQLVIFSLAAVWFAGAALRAGLRGRVATLPSGEVRRIGHDLTDAVMMLAMVWMVAVMGADAGAMMTAGGADGQMAGHDHGMLAPMQVAIGRALTMMMLAAAVSCLTGLTRPRTHGPGRRRMATAASVTMSAGMAAMCWLMALG